MVNDPSAIQWVGGGFVTSFFVPASQVAQQHRLLGLPKGDALDALSCATVFSFFIFAGCLAIWKALMQ